MEKPHCVRLRALAPAVFVLFMLSVTSGHAAGDAASGAAVFVRQCALCHTIDKDGPNRYGPNLFGIVDRKAGAAPGYKYTDAFKSEANWTWSADAIRSFIAAPGAVVPGTRMSVFQGVANKDIGDIIAYLTQQK